MSVLVLKAGILDTLQDAGRHGYSCWGINPGGVLDPFAAAVANALVGNDEHQAVLEFHFPAPQLLFETHCLISICGADFQPTLNGEAVPLWQPILIRKNTCLHFEYPRWGMRSYLAIHGGYHVPEWLGSFSTHLKAKAGGFHGRKLEKSDRISLGKPKFDWADRLKEGEDFSRLNWRSVPDHIYGDEKVIEILPGSEWSQLTSDSQSHLLNGEFTIDPKADRMGFPLYGPALTPELPREMISSGVSCGTLQLLPGGNLIILMADHQTTGGYPKIGHVTSAHIPRLAQLKYGSPFRFRMINLSSAESQLITQKQELAIIKRTCHEHLQRWKSGT